MPVWKPGKQGGKEVNVAYTVPVQFALDGGKVAKAEFPDAPILIQNPPDGVFIVVEEMPEYPGGELALRKLGLWKIGHGSAGHGKVDDNGGQDADQEQIG